MMYDWLEAVYTNKDGNGDKTGLLPEECLDFICTQTLSTDTSSLGC